LIPLGFLLEPPLVLEVV